MHYRTDDQEKAYLLDEMIRLHTLRRELEALGPHKRARMSREIAINSTAWHMVGDTLMAHGYTAEQLDDILEQRTGSRE